jgi:hypothetical protein
MYDRDNDRDSDTRIRDVTERDGFCSWSLAVLIHHDFGSELHHQRVMVLRDLGGPEFPIYMHVYRDVAEKKKITA